MYHVSPCANKYYSLTKLALSAQHVNTHSEYKKTYKMVLELCVAAPIDVIYIKETNDLVQLHSTKDMTNSYVIVMT